MEKYFDNLEEVKFWLEANEEEARMENKLWKSYKTLS